MPNQPCAKLEVTLRSLVPFTPLAHVSPARSNVVHDIATHYHETLIFQRFRRCEDLLSRHLATLRAKRFLFFAPADFYSLRRAPGGARRMVWAEFGLLGACQGQLEARFSVLMAW